ncbi:MAG: excinuclease ABC subunit UvrA [Myxococcales bacterium]|nr:excinuclease ABC subunit UvrA [Myxococcales bacterium]
MTVGAPASIRIRGARVHNLKNITLEIPRERLVAITGPSGSGKSSLAFDTLYAEGQRRYVESLSAYARQFLEQLEKPDVDGIDGLSPAISIEQKSLSHNPRSTVGTVTEIYDYLRLLYARVGQPHCPACGKPITAQTVQEMVDRALSLPEGSRFSVLAPVVRGRKGEFRELFEDLRRRGFSRLNLDGELRDLEDLPALDGRRNHTIEVYVDRLVLRPGLRQRLTDSLETALSLSGGLARLALVDGEDLLFSQRHACLECGRSLPELEPRLFSFNSPHGACPECDGLGSVRFIDPALVVPDPQLPLSRGAIVPWGRRHGGYYYQMLKTVARHYGFSLDTPFAALPKRLQGILLEGSGSETLDFTLEHEGGMRHAFRRPFEGVIPNLERRYRETGSDAVRAEIDRYSAYRDCRACGGRRLRPEALAVTVGGKSIADFTAQNVREALRFLENLPVERQHAAVSARILKEIRERLRFMVDVGLDYLTLDRTSFTLSGGEGQRIRLATQIGSALVGVLYVLDEPTVGLHPRDCRRLLDTLCGLRDRGNTVVVVEHDPLTIRSADWVVDMGPRAGRQGGEVVAQGTPEQIQRDPRSLTGDYLAGRRTIPVPARRRPSTESLRLTGARGHNLKRVAVDFPLGNFVCVTGVSGSGKSTLVIDTLYRSLAQRLYGAMDPPQPFDEIVGTERIDKVLHIDQDPIGRTPRSNPATYTGLFTMIRELFSQTPESRARGYGPGRYSFNVRGGRCESCQGAGKIRVEMHFLPDMFVTCEACAGRRFNRETLEIRFKGKTIAEVLELTVAEALEFFEFQPALVRRLQTIHDVGLGYVQLGQSATTLSGGEAQRIKLSRELVRRATGRTLFILDEPTTGLHMDDIRLLIDVLQRLVDQGNTVVVIEHNLDVIQQADHVIDLGPEGGEDGGRVVAAGTPEALARCEQSYTGRALAEALAPRARARASARV